MTRIVIVGGSDAGISAALRTRELERRIEIEDVLEDATKFLGLPHPLPRLISRSWSALTFR